MAKTNMASDKISTFMEKPLPKPIPYDYKWETYKNKEDAVEANAWPSDADEFVLNRINTQNKASAKSVSYQSTLKTLREFYEDTNEYRRKSFIETATLGGMQEDQAKAIADSIDKMKVVPGEVEQAIVKALAKMEADAKEAAEAEAKAKASA